MVECIVESSREKYSPGADLGGGGGGGARGAHAPPPSGLSRRKTRRFATGLAHVATISI